MTGHGMYAMADIRVQLVDPHLWHTFHQHTNEMIVTKNGRKFFPKISLRFTGMEPNEYYTVAIKLERADPFKYRYCAGQWSAGKSDETMEAHPAVSIYHAEGPTNTGSFWMSGEINFNQFKLTNHPKQVMDKDGAPLICLTSMHKYIPKVFIYEQRSTVYQSDTIIPISTTPLPLAEFIAVTAYQNDNVKKLKVQHNPYAKGFRNGGGVTPATEGQSPNSSHSFDSTSSTENQPPSRKRHAQQQHFDEYQGPPMVPNPYASLPQHIPFFPQNQPQTFNEFSPFLYDMLTQFPPAPFYHNGYSMRQPEYPVIR